MPPVSIRDFPFPAALLIIGDELLDGRVADTNTRALARLCRAQGAQLVETRSVRDDADAIEAALRALADRAEIVVTSGGLGPTVDDRTRAGIARAAGTPLVRSPEAEARVRTAYTSRDAAVTEARLRQADLPASAQLLPSDVGTADAFSVKAAQAEVIALPGVPREFEALLKRYVAPRLQGSTTHAARMVWRTIGAGESDVAERVDAAVASAGGCARVSYLAASPYVVVALDVDDLTVADTLRAEVGAALAPFRLPEGVTRSEEGLLRTARRRGWTLGTAESFTSGLVASRWTSIPGASDVVRGGVVAYASSVKEAALGVPSALLSEYGAVHPKVALAMARGAQRALGADATVATTGIAGPGPGPLGTPSGTVAFGLITPDRACTVEAYFAGRDRDAVTRAGTALATEALRRALEDGTSPLSDLRAHRGVLRVDLRPADW